MSVTSALQAAAPIAVAVSNLLQPFLVPIAGAVGWAVVAAMRKRGYQTTYATAIMRGFGAGVSASQAKGLDPFSPEGRKIVVQEGARYLNDNVAEAGKALGIDTMAGHAARVDAQIGAVIGQAEAGAKAVAASNLVT